MRHLLLLSVAACGNIAPTTPGHDPAPDASPPPVIDAPTADTAMPPPPDGAMAVLDRSCAEVKARLATSSDGRYWIDPDLGGASYKPFGVWCGEMATATPHEYLELAHTSQASDSSPASNYSTYAMGAVHAAWTCPCGVATTLYSKLRIDPTSLTVSGPASFAVYTSSTDLACMQAHAGCPGITPYATAESCVTNYDASGRSNVDLRDVPFHVAGTDTSMFKKNEDFNSAWGFTSAGTATVDGDRKLVSLTGGGDCGGFGAVTGLVLAQDL